MGRSLLLAGSAVNGFGMHVRLGVVGIDRRGVVVGVRCLAPGRAVVIRGAVAVLEVPWENELPSAGDQLVAEIAYPDSHARNVGPLRHPHWQPE
jgi:hypothetical protein